MQVQHLYAAADERSAVLQVLSFKLWSLQTWNHAVINEMLQEVRGNKTTSNFNVVIYITAIYNATKSDT
jgi:hypothetical protein